MIINKSVMRLALILAMAALTLAGVIAIETAMSHSRYALFNAAQDGDLEAVKRLIHQGAPIDLQVPSSFGWTPLIAAINQEKTNVAYYLIGAGADVNLADTNGETPLMWQIAHGDNGAPLVEYLIAHGARVDATNKDGITVDSYAHSNPPKPKIIEIIDAATRGQHKKRNLRFQTGNK